MGALLPSPTKQGQENRPQPRSAAHVANSFHNMLSASLVAPNIPARPHDFTAGSQKGKTQEMVLHGLVTTSTMSARSAEVE